MISALQKDPHQQNAKDWKENTPELAGGFILVKVSCQVFSSCNFFALNF